MIATGARMAMAIVRIWTRVYTAGLPRPERERRREEVDADVWETAHAERRVPGAPAAVEVLARLLTGVADDIGWRVEREVAMTRTSGLAITAVAVAGLAGTWMIVSLRTPTPPNPAPPPKALLLATVAAPPPPPPPPPPTLPGEQAPDISVSYAEVSYSTLGGAPVPVRLNDVRPVHPPIARWNGVGGMVVVEATVDEQGRVSDARIRESVRMLDQSAIDAVRQWVFQPPMAGGRPTSVTLRVTLTYSIPPSPVAAPR
jgi:TonB family protein